MAVTKGSAFIPPSFLGRVYVLHCAEVQTPQDYIFVHRDQSCRVACVSAELQKRRKRTISLNPNLRRGRMWALGAPRRRDWVCRRKFGHFFFNPVKSAALGILPRREVPTRFELRTDGADTSLVHRPEGPARSRGALLEVGIDVPRPGRPSCNLQIDATPCVF